MIVTNQFVAKGLPNLVGNRKDLKEVIEGDKKVGVVLRRFNMKFCFRILAVGQNIRKEGECYYMSMRFNKLDDLFNFGFNRDREIEQKINDKFDQQHSRELHIWDLIFSNITLGESFGF